MAFNFELMEEELTCPVCLELYRDPLMLPCSHSLCKKCLTEILCKNESQHASTFRCPSCRSSVNISQESFSALPKNLVLENIVVRYIEERNKISRRSLLLDSWSFGEFLPTPKTPGSPSIPCASSCATPTFCELCDPLNVPSKAVLACAQCDVSYCQSCFSKYHPNRGALARHKIKNISSMKNHRNSMHIQNHMFLSKTNAAVAIKPAAISNLENITSSPLVMTGSTSNCSDHKSEPSTMFCDRCKVLVCHVCVCDGEGRHSGHKMLTLETAASSTMNLANHTKEQCDSIVTLLKEKQTRMTQFSAEIKDLHKSACSRIEQQYRRFIEDLTNAIEEEKRLTLRRMDEARGRLARRTESQRMESEKCIINMTEVASCCAEVVGEGRDTGSADVLLRAVLLHPVIMRFKKNRKEVSLLRKRCDNLLKDKSGRLLFLSGTEHFRKRVDKLLTWFLDDGLSGGDTIVPKISTSPTHQPNCVTAAEAGPPSGHRMFKQPNLMSRCLTTWGGEANGVTTYTGETVQKQCSWTVTIEHNLSTSSFGEAQFLSFPSNPTAPVFNPGSYLFGAGISDDPLSIRDLVGMSSASRGIACIGGSIYFCSKSGQQSQDLNKPTYTYLSRLESLPISLTLALKIESPDTTILSYKMTSLAPDGRRVLSLVGRKIIRDLVPGSKIYPVFTVTSKVKILFPTYV